MAAEALQEQVRGVVLLNSAGQFGDANTVTNEPEAKGFKKYVLNPLKEVFQRVVLGFLFWQAKQPARIESVLKSVSDFSPDHDLISPSVFFNQKETYFLVARYMPLQSLLLVCPDFRYI